MSKEIWTAVDHYMIEKLIPRDPVLDEALQANAAGGLPAIDVAPNQGKLLQLLARIQGARRILEIGTLGGYSTIWLARALPSDGKLITLEAEAKHAEVAKANIQRAGLSSIVELRLGPALESLSQLHKEKTAPFDLIFVDADKVNSPGYLEWSLKLSRPGTILILDNVVRDGAVIHAEDADPGVQGMRRFFDMVGVDPRLDATALQTVGSKGYDGFALMIVKSAV
jgi:predicted O-methyltransferase YrrM